VLSLDSVEPKQLSGVALDTKFAELSKKEELGSMKSASKRHAGLTNGSAIGGQACRIKMSLERKLGAQR
jgi:hypothetical protein